MINLLLRTSALTVHVTDDNSPVTQCNISTVLPYQRANQFFNFKVGDLVIILSAGGAMDLRNIARISGSSSLLTNMSSVDIKRVFIFTEDLYTFKGDTAEEIIFLKRLVEHMKYDCYQIYHCEQNVSKLNTLGLDIKYFDWFVCSTLEYYTSVLYTPSVSYRFENTLCCLNRRFGEHRYLTSAVLSNFSNVHFTQQYSLQDTTMHYIDIDAITDPVKTLVSQGLENLKNRNGLLNRNISVETIEPFDYSSDTAVNELNNITRNSFCSIITESRYHTEFPNFSEKTLRVIYSGRPFLLLAPAGTLKLLQQLGIKTFGKFWDESYDDIVDPTERFQAVMQIAIKLASNSNLNIAPLKPILEYNQKQLASIPKRMFRLL